MIVNLWLLAMQFFANSGLQSDAPPAVPRLKPNVENITAKSNYNDDVVVTATLTIPGF